jgi:hypothetical protein
MKQSTHTKKKGVFQLVLLVVMVALCSGAFFFVQQIFKIPFRSANDALHEKDAALTLDFLIPAGTHINKNMTVGEVLKIRLEKKSSPFEAVARALSEQIPASYIWLGNLLLFFFWSFCVLTLLRIFTFLGYGRALRTSLLLGGVTYYFMPDFSPYPWEDVLFVACPLLLILFRFFWIRRKKRIFSGDSV